MANTYYPSNLEIEEQIRKNANMVDGDTYGITFMVFIDTDGNAIMGDITRLYDGRRIITIYDPWRERHTDDTNAKWASIYSCEDVGVYADVATDFILRLINTKK